MVAKPRTFRDERPQELMEWKMPANQSILPASRMMDSYVECVIPLSTDEQLREKYATFYNTLRVGRLLEDLDVLGVYISFKHNTVHYPGQSRSPYVIVTAAVDQIDIDSRITTLSIEKDVILRGHVTWVGRSSIETTMEDADDIWQGCMIAKFVMVARDPANAKAAIIHPLVCKTPAEKLIFQLGQELKGKRLLESCQSLLKIPPNEEETELIHNLFLQTIDQSTMSFRNITKPKGTKWMNDSKLKNLFLCFPEQRNLYNKVFGGFLMRIAFELAWASQMSHTKSRPVVKSLADISFRKPVDIGSLLYLSSMIVYTKDYDTQIKVNAEVINPMTEERSLTNTFQITFTSAEKVVPIIPASYSEFMMFIDGKRFYNKCNK
ncbi:DgyrCDS2284 [Dimorphilus gyrociliatus]|uniref:DgyrCDS2284 n=1 Tax=Dimorphilus gyrociliatus TaxID=2664684 RepID=A0A7I8VA25_9ANNE|nr:DgyrCDS2284 [Dimorphilus gyrociliatus]